MWMRVGADGANAVAALVVIALFMVRMVRFEGGPRSSTKVTLMSHGDHNMEGRRSSRVGRGGGAARRLD